MSFSAFLAFPGQGSQHLSMLSAGGITDIALSKEFSYALECCSDLISHDVFKLIEVIQLAVKDKFGIDLQLEVKLLGF